MPEANHKPRVGIPYRTRKEELTGDRAKLEPYLEAVRQAGGDPVAVSLVLPPEQLTQLAETLDAIVLPGSPADVNPALFHAARLRNAPILTRTASAPTSPFSSTPWRTTNLFWRSATASRA